MKPADVGASFIAGPPYFEAAQKEIGVREVVGAAHNPAIMGYWQDAKITWMTTNGDEEPWCAVFVNAMLERSGVPGNRSAWALDFRNWGRACEPRVGCVVVLHRHVGFYGGHSEDGRHVYVLGGNQSDAVRWSWYPADRVVAYRAPKEDAAETNASVPVHYYVPTDDTANASGEDTSRVRRELRDKGSRTIEAADKIEVATKTGIGSLFALGVFGKVAGWLGELLPHAATVRSFLDMAKDHQFLILGILGLVILSNTKSVVFARIDDFLKGIRRR